MLTGKYKSISYIPKDSRAAKLDNFRKNDLKEESIAKVKQLEAVAADLNISIGHLSLAWIFRQPNVASALVCASRPEQVEDNVKASNIVLSAEVLERVEAIINKA